jgi:hypothetical protein
MIAVKLGLLDALTTKFIYLPRAWVENLCIKAQAEFKAYQTTDVTLTRNYIITA